MVRRERQDMSKDSESNSRGLVVLLVILAIVFVIGTAIAAQLTDATVSSNWLAGIRSASSFLGIVLFIGMAAVALGLLAHFTRQKGK